jgi:hypothetical protein
VEVEGTCHDDMIIVESLKQAEGSSLALRYDVLPRCCTLLHTSYHHIHLGSKIEKTAD